MTGEIKKRYFHKGKIVFLLLIDNHYCFKIEDKCNKKEYYSDLYSTLSECEKDSYKVVKNI